MKFMLEETEGNESIHVELTPRGNSEGRKKL